jgi:hypothetical protein
MRVIAIVRQLLLFVPKRTPYHVEDSGLARAQVAKIRTCFGEAQRAIRPTAYFVRIMVILTIIFPEADRTDFIMPSPV